MKVLLARSDAKRKVEAIWLMIPGLIDGNRAVREWILRELNEISPREGVLLDFDAGAGPAKLIGYALKVCKEIGVGFVALPTDDPKSVFVVYTGDGRHFFSGEILTKCA